MRRLDIRYSKKVSTEGGTIARKMRKLGEPSKSLPPSDAPDWTVDPSKLTDRYNNVSLEARLFNFMKGRELGTRSLCMCWKRTLPASM